VLRIIRPDLLCGLGGFMLGTAALLLNYQAAASPPPPAPADNQVLIAASSADHTRPNAR
jgi:hypothetical protein